MNKTKQKNYNLQPYGANGDTTGWRTIDWFRQNVLSEISHYLKGDGLDIGSGNGRLNSLFSPYFDTLMCTDPIETLNAKFKCPNVKFKQLHIHEISGEYDTILFMGSWNIIYEHHKENVLKICDNLLKPNGYIIAMWDCKTTKNYNLNYENFMGSSIITKDQTSHIQIWRKI